MTRPRGMRLTTRRMRSKLLAAGTLWTLAASAEAGRIGRATPGRTARRRGGPQTALDRGAADRVRALQLAAVIPPRASARRAGRIGRVAERPGRYHTTHPTRSAGAPS